MGVESIPVYPPQPAVGNNKPVDKETFLKGINIEYRDKKGTAWDMMNGKCPYAKTLNSAFEKGGAEELFNRLGSLHEDYDVQYNVSPDMHQYISESLLVDHPDKHITLSEDSFDKTSDSKGSEVSENDRVPMSSDAVIDEKPTEQVVQDIEVVPETVFQDSLNEMEQVVEEIASISVPDEISVSEKDVIVSEDVKPAIPFEPGEGPSRGADEAPCPIDAKDLLPIQHDIEQAEVILEKPVGMVVKRDKVVTGGIVQEGISQPVRREEGEVETIVKATTIDTPVKVTLPESDTVVGEVLAKILHEPSEAILDLHVLSLDQAEDGGETVVIAQTHPEAIGEDQEVVAKEMRQSDVFVSEQLPRIDFVQIPLVGRVVDQDDKVRPTAQIASIPEQESEAKPSKQTERIEDAAYVLPQVDIEKPMKKDFTEPIPLKQIEFQVFESVSKVDMDNNTKERAESAVKKLVDLELARKQRGEESEEIQVAQQKDRIILSGQTEAAHKQSEDSIQPALIHTVDGLKKAFMMVEARTLTKHVSEKGGVVQTKDETQKNKPRVAIAVSREIFDMVEGLGKMDEIVLGDAMRQAESHTRGDLALKDTSKEGKGSVHVEKSENIIVIKGNNALANGVEKDPQEQKPSIKKLSDLHRAFDYVGNIAQVTPDLKEQGKDKIHKERCEDAEVEIVVSSKMMELVEAVNREIRTKQMPIKKDGAEVDALYITFSASDTDKRQLRIGGTEFSEIRRYMLDHNIIIDPGEREEKRIEMRSNVNSRRKIHETVDGNDTKDISSDIAEKVYRMLSEEKTDVSTRRKSENMFGLPTGEDIYADEQYVLITTGNKEMRIEMAKLKKVLLQYEKIKKTKKTTIIFGDEVAPEEVKRDDIPVQGDDSNPLWFGYQFLYFILSFPYERSDQYWETIYQSSPLRSHYLAT